MKKSTSKVNAAGNYTKPTMRKKLFNKIKSGTKGETLGSGVPARLNSSPRSIKKPEGDTAIDYEKISTIA